MFPGLPPLLLHTVKQSLTRRWEGLEIRVFSSLWNVLAGTPYMLMMHQRMQQMQQEQAQQQMYQTCAQLQQEVQDLRQKQQQTQQGML